MGDVSPEPVNLIRPDGSVVVPAAVTDAVVRLLVLGVTEARHRNAGGQLSPQVMDVLHALNGAALRASVTPADVPTTEPETPGTGKMEVTAAEAAVMRGCSPEMIRRMCRAGQLHSRMLGRIWLVDAAHLDQQTTGTRRHGYPKH